ncbi:hypothetical protein BOX15_Mlig016151g2, partial [Macrostomum lignano]
SAQRWSSLELFSVYETASHYYVIGSDQAQTYFRLFKLSRTDKAEELNLFEDSYEYSLSEIHRFLQCFCAVQNAQSIATDQARQQQQQQKASPLPEKCINACGILGFVRFTEGYYLALVTRASVAAQLCEHTVHRIEEARLVCLHPSGRPQSSEEQRYVRQFGQVDLASNFYYCRSYDLMHTVQHNFTASPSDYSSSSSSSSNPACLPDQLNPDQLGQKWCWNLAWLTDRLSPGWQLRLLHGYIGQSSIDVCGRTVFATLIGRRSRRYAGTRYLKRGCDYQGNAANEVETEQVLHDPTSCSFALSRVTAFVQVRGSVPAIWSQDIQGVVTKPPPVTVHFTDSTCAFSGQHFCSLLARYGSPIQVVNLMKQQRRSQREVLLTQLLTQSVRYLNQFVPASRCLLYRHFDMARIQKQPGRSVLLEFAPIAADLLAANGLFCRQAGRTESVQLGVARTNCVDCLDRTNTAQYVLGLLAAGRQLDLLGLVDYKPDETPFNTQLDAVITNLYEDHGDALALQYGGSQLVHNVDTYRKSARTVWGSQRRRDLGQTLQRYINNTFTDTEKQQAISLFLGVFRPPPRNSGKPHLWELGSEAHLHSKPSSITGRRNTRAWCPDQLLAQLPYPSGQAPARHQQCAASTADPVVQLQRELAFHRLYQPWLLTLFPPPPDTAPKPLTIGSVGQPLRRLSVDQGQAERYSSVHKFAAAAAAAAAAAVSGSSSSLASSVQQQQQQHQQSDSGADTDSLDAIEVASEASATAAAAAYPVWSLNSRTGSPTPPPPPPPPPSLAPPAPPPARDPAPYDCQRYSAYASFAAEFRLDQFEASRAAPAKAAFYDVYGDSSRTSLADMGLRDRQLCFDCVHVSVFGPSVSERDARVYSQYIQPDLATYC